MADRRDILVNLLGKETVSAAAGKAGKGLDKLGDSFDSTADDARRLDGEIGEVEQSLRDLAVMYARTGDAAERLDISKAMRKQQTELRKLTKSRDLLGDPFKDGVRFGGRLADGMISGLSAAGGPISKALGGVFGALPPQAQAAIGASVIAAVGSVAPLAAGVLAGAVVGGVGIGGVVGGMAIAAKHADVQKAGTQLGDTLKTVMQRSAISFVPATVDALGDVRSEIFGMEDDFRRIFSKASTYVAPLTRGVTGFAKNLLPGVEDAVDRGGVVIDELAAWGPRLGTLLSDVFTKFAGEAQNGAAALGAFWTVMEAGIRFTANTIVGLTAVYGGMRVLSALLRNDIGTLMEIKAGAEAAKQGGDELGPTLQNLIAGFGGVGEKAETAAQKNERLLGSLNALTNAAASSRMATIDFEAGLDELTASVGRNGTSLDVGSEKGRANLQVIEGLIGAADRAGKAAEDQALAQGAGAEAAAAAGAKIRSTYVKDLETAAGKAGFSRQRIAEMVAAMKAADGQRAQMYMDIITRHQTIYMKPGTQDGGIGGKWYKGAADGGPVTGRGPKGVDSEPYLLAPGEHVMTADEVDAAGGHRKVEAWRKSLLSGRPAPAMAGGGGSGSGGGAQRVEVVLRIDGSDRGIIGALLKGIKDMGGNPAVLGIGGSW